MMKFNFKKIAMSLLTAVCLPAFGAENVTYDYEYLDMPVFCKGTWFGCRMNNEGNHTSQAFYTVVGNKQLEGWNEEPQLQNEGLAYEFMTWQNDPVNFRNPLPAEGTYTFGKDETAGEKVLWQYSRIYKRDGNGNYEWKRSITDGTLTITVTTEDDEKYYNYDLTVTDEKNKTHHVTYKSRFVSYEDDSDGPSDVLCKDIDVTAISERAYFKKTTAAGDAMHLRILFSDMPYDAEYDEWSAYPGSIFYTELYAPMSAQGLANGEYIVTEESGAPFTVQAGEIAEMAGVRFARGSYNQYVDALSRIHWGVYESGKLVVSGEGAERRIEGTFTTPEGFNIHFVYNGELPILNMPESGLTADRVLDLTDADVTFEYHGDVNAHGDAANWKLIFTPVTGTDGLQIELATGTKYYGQGILTGTYKASPSKEAWPGEYSKGKREDGAPNGTWYLGDIDEEGIPHLLAPAASGNLDVNNVGDGKYDLRFNFDDGLGHKWSGEWAGTPKCVKVGAGPDFPAGVDDVTIGNTISLEGRDIVLAATAEVTVADLTGRIIFRGVAERVTLPEAGLYIVTANTKTVKVIAQ